MGSRRNNQWQVIEEIEKVAKNEVQEKAQVIETVQEKEAQIEQEETKLKIQTK